MFMSEIFLQDSFAKVTRDILLPMTGAELSHVIFPVVPSVSVAVIVSFSPLINFISFFDRLIPLTSSTP